MYHIKGRIRYSECGQDNKIKLSSIINYFQDCTTENSEMAGVGHQYLKERNRAWILNSWQLSIRRRPKVGEQIQVSTWATGFQGVFGPRDFQMTTDESEELVSAHSLWVYVETETGRPVKPSEEELHAYEVGQPLSMASAPRKIQLPEQMQVVDTFPVHKYHIDTNNHVNNARYVEIACEALPENFSVTGLRVEYKKAAICGETFILKSGRRENSLVTALCDAQDKVYAIVEFIGED